MLSCTVWVTKQVCVQKEVKPFFLKLLKIVSFGEIYEKQAVYDIISFYLEKEENLAVLLQAIECTFLLTS